MKHTVKAWAWVETTPDFPFPIHSVDETKEIVALEKREFLNPPDKQKGKILRSLYRNTRVVPCTITYETP